MDRGCHNLKRFDPHDGTVRLYPVPGPITAILEKAPEWMWIGTGMGLYLLDGHGGTCRHIAFPVEAVHVYALYQAPDGLLYIGTGGRDFSSMTAWRTGSSANTRPRTAP